MLVQIEAQIYLESQRGHFEQDGFRSLRTFNFEGYHAECREPVGNLLAFNDETLLAQHSYWLEAEEICQVILLPMVGGIEVSDGTGKPVFVDSGEFSSVTLGLDQRFQITNPYADEAVNYLQIRLKNEDSELDLPFSGQFDLLRKNILHLVNHRKGVSISIGKYDGREEDIFNTLDHAAFVFIIEGAFEVQNRLLEKRDALSIRGAEEIDFEALSNGAVILVMQV